MKYLQTDRGSEYKPLLPILAQQGMVFKHPCLRTHQQNGIAKWKHRDIVVVRLTVLAQTYMPLYFWWDAFVMVVFFINRLPSQALNHISPFESL